MGLAERLHYTLNDLIDSMDAQELSLWYAMDVERSEDEKKNGLVARLAANSGKDIGQKVDVNELVGEPKS